ncbi:hypothetical protein LSH36_59g02015 [Paralvinella palmiformis]|uniref:Uncharacterized protein n=1 Tax=Paralvinella palmiformis TaxID=53620 RepID=A0AAD9K4U0_9ANNE|nr:hypothetical protein LSH36_59g02015 [Paralvinella palmiformis]
MASFPWRDLKTFRSLFYRSSNKQLSAITAKFITNSTVGTCADHCVKETEFQCRSFDFDNSVKACLLFTVNLDDTDVRLIKSTGRDHYETSYSKLFNRLPSHRLPVVINRAVLGVSMESCARHCIMESYFKCRGFNYRKADQRCMLVENTPVTSTGAIFTQGVDYFERKPEDVMSNFINFGMGRMHPLTHSSVHQSVTRGSTLTECAQSCLNQTQFDCLSFDYVFEGVDSICYLSKYIAANVGGLVIDVSQVQHNHYERIGEFMSYFYVTPYAVIPGNNLKQYGKVTPNRCAQYCLEEELFICRSFDYRIKDAVCMLSDKAGSDVGGLVTEGGYEGDVHHFEMKPMLDCGGNLTSPVGSIASPNWPRDYAHYENCVWYITTTPHKVLHLHFTHFELGLQSSDPCNGQDDRLMLEEAGLKYCIMPNTKDINTKSHAVKLTFYTNGHVDARGFRMFYSSEWTCNENLDRSGEFASPKWPSSYPSGSRCSWKITAPRLHRIHLTFNSFELEKHSLGHCNERYDHVKILDGGTVNSPFVGLYCGSLEPFVVKSTGQDMFIQFVSDNDPDNTRQGFHASFVFEMQNQTMFDGILAGPGYKALDEEQEDINILEGDSKQIKSEAQASVDDGDMTISLVEHRRYKRSMWAAVTILLLLLVAAVIGMFLIYRHYRGQLYNELEVVHQDGQVIALQNMPMTNLCDIKPNNDCDITAGSSTPLTLGAEGGCQTNEECVPNNLDFGKYAKENVKNINVDTKNYNDDFV